ncbi:MAG: DUF2189 domain-containing protein [Pseudomonadota bacterium]
MSDTPTDAAPEGDGPKGATSGDAKPEDAKSEAAKPEAPNPEAAKSKGAKSSGAKPEEAKPEEAKSGAVTPGEAASGDARPGGAGSAGGPPMILVDGPPVQPEAAAAPQAPARPRGLPAIETIGYDDLGAAFRAGVEDFKRAPMFGVFFGGVYAVGGLIMLWLSAVMDAPWLILPLVLAFPLVGPFVAVGLYDVSRRLARDEKPKWGEVLGVMLQQRKRELGWMAFVVLFICFVWFYQIRTILVIFLQNESFSSMGDFLTVAVTTQAGWGFLIVGSLVGGFLALVLFSTTVVAIPLLLERDRDFITAMITSVKAVTSSPRPMVAWGITVTVLVMAAALPLFLGLIVILPVLGHATWHLYKKLVGPEPEAETA